MPRKRHPKKEIEEALLYAEERGWIVKANEMKTYEFKLRFKLPVSSQDPVHFVERLAEEGCTDALVGIGQSGRIALIFNREADNALEAILSAVGDVKTAIPDAMLIEAAPDLVGLSDIAEILGCSRQNIRKLMLNNLASFPTPIHEGKTTLWHLNSVLTWAKKRPRYRIDESLQEIAEANMQLNIAKESVHLDATIKKLIFEGTGVTAA